MSSISMASSCYNSLLSFSSESYFISIFSLTFKLLILLMDLCRIKQKQNLRRCLHRTTTQFHHPPLSLSSSPAPPPDQTTLTVKRRRWRWSNNPTPLLHHHHPKNEETNLETHVSTSYLYFVVIHKHISVCVRVQIPKKKRINKPQWRVFLLGGNTKRKEP